MGPTADHFCNKREVTVKLTFRTSFLNLSLTLFETDDAEAAAVYGNTLGQYEIAPEAEIEYEPDEPEAFGFCV